MTDIENTSTRHPLIHAMGLMGGSDDYIYGMEAAGQRQVVASDYLPTQGDWETVEALGVVRGEVKAGDEMFTHVRLPPGWTRAGTDHSMHSEVRDERGVKRISIFYKAAFYDRRADFYVVNIGREIASHMEYSENDLALPEYWGVLTDKEKQQAKEAVSHDLRHTSEHVSSYGDRDGHWQAKIDRCSAALALIEAAL